MHELVDFYRLWKRLFNYLERCEGHRVDCDQGEFNFKKYNILKIISLNNFKYEGIKVLGVFVS